MSLPRLHNQPHRPCSLTHSWYEIVWQVPEAGISLVSPCLWNAFPKKTYWMTSPGAFDGQWRIVYSSRLSADFTAKWFIVLTLTTYNFNCLFYCCKLCRFERLLIGELGKKQCLKRKEGKKERNKPPEGSTKIKMFSSSCTVSLMALIKDSWAGLLRKQQALLSVF